MFPNGGMPALTRSTQDSATTPASATTTLLSQSLCESFAYSSHSLRLCPLAMAHTSSCSSSSLPLVLRLSNVQFRFPSSSPSPSPLPFSISLSCPIRSDTPPCRVKETLLRDLRQNARPSQTRIPVHQTRHPQDIRRVLNRYPDAIWGYAGKGVFFALRPPFTRSPVSFLP